MFCGPTGLSVPHTIAPPNPEIGSAAERGCASTDEAKLWVEGPLRKKAASAAGECFTRDDAMAPAKTALLRGPW